LGYYNDGNIIDAGLNTTNSFPIIQPATPGPGLVWEVDQLYPQGIIRVLSATDPSLTYTMTNNFTIVGHTNMVIQFSWPQDKIGGWIQQLNTTLTNGLSATNWTSINGNYFTNTPPNMSATNVWYITNNLIGDPNAPGAATFFRFVYP